MKRHVLVPLDGSDLSEAALPMARRLTRSSGSVLELVTVYDRGSIPVEEWDSAYPEIARSYLDRIAGELTADGSTVETSFLVGNPADQIRALAAKQESDFVVMSTHGRGPFSRFWLGSVTDDLVRTMPAPLVLIRPEDESAEGEEPGLINVLVTLDGSENAEAVLPTAAAMGHDFGAHYTLLRVIRYPDELVSAYMPNSVQLSQQVVDEGVRNAKAYLEPLVAKLREEGLEADARVVVDSRPASAIIGYAQDQNMDLIAMATHGRGGVTRALMGSVTDKVVRGAHTPVLVVRSTEEA